MPTIDQLESAIVAADDDMLPVSQNGIARRVSRSQLLAGTQATLSIPPGLLGRSSSGLGPPQQIAVGGGLSLTGGILSSAPRFSAASLPATSNANSTDLVPIWQQGQDKAVSVRALLSVSGIDVSNQVVKANIGSTRLLEEWLGDAVAVEAFGARGDGATDDSDAINLAIASGRPVLLGPKTYRVDGQWNIQSSTTLIGAVGMTVLRRISQVGGAWINITAPSFASVGVIFDAGGISGESWGVLVAPSCKHTFIQNCSFINVTGATLGTGLTIQARDGLTGHGSTHCILTSNFQNNACHGIWVQAASDASISHCQASYNGGFGICLDFNDPQFQQTVRTCSVTHSRCWNNNRGISIGNYNATNSEPPKWGLENPDAVDITVAWNVCSGNASYGIAVSGKRIHVAHNQILVDDSAGLSSGILCNASLATLESNSIVGPGAFGIDAGGSVDTSISSNVISGCAMGVNAGGSARTRIAGNKLINNIRAITLFQIETDGRGSNFGLASCDTWIEDNLIQLGAGHGGIFLFDGPENVEVLRNRFTSQTADSIQDVCWAHTDSAWISGNTLNGSPVVAASSQITDGLVEVTVPDILDYAVLAASLTKVDAIFGLHQLAMIGQVSFIRVTNGGQGYTQARVIIAGSGFGTTASAYLRDGVVIGVALRSGGNGYDPATTSATVVGDGMGAILQAVVGVPLPKNRRLSLRCLSPVHFTQGNAGGMQANWTNTDITTAAGSEIVLLAVDGVWQAVSFENIDYVVPSGDGGVSIRSIRGDIGLHVAAGCGVRYQSDLEQSGFLTYFGRGSPEGAVMAPPGSDYRNLSGGIGTTLWIKRVGTDSSGWFSVA